jgi:hypothetical protein
VDAGGRARRFNRQIERGARIGMNRANARARGGESLAQTIAADAEGGGDARGAMAERTEGVHR